MHISFLGEFVSGQCWLGITWVRLEVTIGKLTPAVYNRLFGFFSSRVISESEVRTGLEAAEYAQNDSWLYDTWVSAIVTSRSFAKSYPETGINVLQCQYFYATEGLTPIWNRGFAKFYREGSCANEIVESESLGQGLSEDEQFIPFPRRFCLAWAPSNS